MPAESLNCPNCGASLHHVAVSELCFCQFCNSLIRLQGDDETPVPTLERKLKTKEMNEIKQQLTSGQRQAAIFAFEDLASLESEEAEAVIDRMAADLSTRNIFQQQLTRGGMVMVVVCLILVPTSLLAWGLRALSPLLSMVYLAMGCYGLYKYGRGALNTLRYRKALVAKARIQQAIPVGVVQRARFRVHAYLFDLEVEPEGSPPFRAQAVIPVLEENIERVKKGETIQVKYLPGEPDSVIFHQT